MMGNQNLKCVLSAAAIFGVPCVAMAGSGETATGTDQMVQVSAHVHGAWEMLAALDGDALTIVLTGPLADLVGEEHAAGSHDEEAAVTELNEQLIAGAPLVTLGGKARCQSLVPVSVTTISDAEHDHADDHHATGEKNNEHDHEHHMDGDPAHHQEHDDHDDHDKEDHHDAQAPDHDDAKGHGSDIEITYLFNCNSPGKLSSVEAAMFGVFDGVETVDAIFLDGSKQIADRLTPQKRALSID